MKTKDIATTIECPNCHKRFDIFERYDEDFDCLTKCTSCGCQASRFVFNYIESIAVGDMIKNSKESKENFFFQLNGKTGKIVKILPAGTYTFFGTTKLTFDETMYAVDFGKLAYEKGIIFRRDTFTTEA